MVGIGWVLTEEFPFTIPCLSLLKLLLVTMLISQSDMLTPLSLPWLVPFMPIPLLYLWLHYCSMDCIATCHMSQSLLYLYINQSFTWENPSWNSLVTHQVLCLLFSSVTFTALGDIGRIPDWSILTLSWDYTWSCLLMVWSSVGVLGTFWRADCGIKSDIKIIGIGQVLAL